MGNKLGKGGSDSSVDSDVEDWENAEPGSIHRSMVRHRKKDVLKKYKVVEVLGNGSMGFVAKAKVRANQVGGSATKKKSILPIKKTTISDLRKNEVYYALKSIQVDRVSALFINELRNEIDILATMDHPNIVKALEVYDYKRQIYIVLELCDGGDLYKRLPYSEKSSAQIVGKVLSAVKYMHDHGIVHRDLKFENIMFENKSPTAEVKIIDFGLSKKFLAGQPDTMTEGVGTISTMAPQVLQGVYTSQADLWSVGVIAYMLLSAHRPFYHKRRKVMIDRIMRADYSLGGEVWANISDLAKDMVANLLVLDPRERMNATQALAHDWLSSEFKLSDRRPSESLTMAVGESLVQYKETSELKKIALNVIAHRSSTEEILELRKVFDQYDSGNDGIITFEEFKKALEEAHYPEDGMEEIFESIDVNRNGHIMYTEFLAATLEAHGHIEEERIADAFDRLDSDDSGYISRENLREFLGSEISSKQITDIINESDKDKDGKLSYKEFLEMFRKNTTKMSRKVARMDSSMSNIGDSELVGLDAKIPGGKYDSSVGPDLANVAEEE